jgi:hypothetical protein
MDVKHFIKVWSQAGATLVAVTINLLIAFGAVSWTSEQVAIVNTFYATVMILLRQLYSVTDSTP